MPTAVLIDGGYFIKRFRRIEPHNAYNAQRAAEVAHRWAIAHLKHASGERRDLYRIFFYDCPPLRKKMHNPISGLCIDYSRSDEALFRTSLHEALKQKRKVALRLGHLTDFSSWTTGSRTFDDLLKGKRTFGDLQADEAGASRAIAVCHPGNHQCYLNTTVRWPLSRMRCSTCRRTARASTCDSVSLPSRTSSLGVIAWSTRATSCSMIGPSSRSSVT